jgi:hypothetical protein
MVSVRPTLRCLREGLSLPVPPLDRLLDEVDHPLLGKAREQFTDADTPHERIAAIDDQVLFKVKVQRWRGAVWAEPALGWLVAAGWRESGSAEDFYAVLASDGKKARARYNTDHKPALSTDTLTTQLLPDADDRLRYRLESAVGSCAGSRGHSRPGPAVAAGWSRTRGGPRHVQCWRAGPR